MKKKYEIRIVSNLDLIFFIYFDLTEVYKNKKIK